MKRRWIGAALVLLSTACTLLIVEIAVRLADPFQFRPKRDAAIFASRTYRLSKSKGLRYELKPGSRAEFSGIEFQVNAAGFRDRPYRIAKRERQRIVFAGDSLTYGWLIPLADTYHKQLERMLAGGGRRIEVLGMGVVGYNLVQEYFLIKGKVARFSPDLLVLQIGPNDFERTVTVKETAEQGRFRLTPYHDFQVPYMVPVNGLTRALMSHSHLFRFINLKLYWLRKKRAPDFAPGNVFQLGEEKAFRYLDRIVGFCRKAGIPLAAVFFPTRHGEDRYAYAALHEKAGRRLRQMGVPFLDLDRALNSVRDRDIWVDGFHPNREGMEIAARELAAFVLPLLDRR